MVLRQIFCRFSYWICGSNTLCSGSSARPQEIFGGRNFHGNIFASCRLIAKISRYTVIIMYNRTITDFEVESWRHTTAPCHSEHEHDVAHSATTLPTSIFAKMPCTCSNFRYRLTQSSYLRYASTWGCASQTPCKAPSMVGAYKLWPMGEIEPKVHVGGGRSFPRLQYMLLALLPFALGYMQNRWGHTDIGNCIVNCIVASHWVIYIYSLIRSGKWCREHKNFLLWATPHRHGWTKTFFTPIISGSISLTMPLGYVRLCVRLCVCVCVFICVCCMWVRACCVCVCMHVCLHTCVHA